MATPEVPPPKLARRLIRGARTAAFSTLLPPDAQPYGSLVLVAADFDATPILLLSRLAEHTRNLAADARVALLYDGTAGLTEPLTGPRLTVLGRASLSDATHHRTRFLARHPGAEVYVDFADFAFYKVEIERGHLVAGFGRIHWIDDLRFNAGFAALAEAEAGIVAHMNEDHADAVQLYANRLLGRGGSGWRMIGCDPEGCDLAQGADLARLDFDRPIADAAGARAELVRLAQRARAKP